MNKKVVYIAGKINGLSNYRELFKAAEKEFLAKGYIVMNPAELPEGMPYKKYLPITLAMLEASDYIYMLNNWKNSKGATVEHDYAVAQGISIIYQDGDNNENN